MAGIIGYAQDVATWQLSRPTQFKGAVDIMSLTPPVRAGVGANEV